MSYCYIDEKISFDIFKYFFFDIFKFISIYYRKGSVFGIFLCNELDNIYIELKKFYYYIL